MAKPKLALIPATQGSKLYSVLPADGVGDFNFSRNSAATRINKDGLIETVAVGKSRLNYPLIDGVVNGCPSHLLEPSRLQKIQYSEDFSQSTWSKFQTSISVNEEVSPDGTLNADKLIPTNVNNNHPVSSVSINGSSNNYSASCYFKKGEYNYGFIRLITDSAAKRYGVLINLTNGVVENEYTTGSPSNTSYKIDELTNGWYRLSLTSLNTSGTVQLTASASNVSNPNIIGNIPHFLGDGTSGIYAWGAQLEQGSFPTSYIPNYGTSAGITRVAETANGAGDASTFNSSEGVLMVEISALANDGTTRVLSISDGGNAANVVRIGYSINSNEINVRLIVNSVTNQFDYVGNTLNQNKIALKWKLNDVALWVNGVEVYTNLSFTTFSLNVLNVLNFSNGNGTSNPFYGNTKQIQYYDSSLNNSDLEKITSWTSFTDLANGQTYSIK